MILIDSSVLVDVLRDRSGKSSLRVKQIVGEDDLVFSRFTQMELLQGARDDADWSQLDEYLTGQAYLEAEPTTWRDAGRLYFELRRKGKTVRNIIDCVVAQLCLDARVTLLHNDRDFEAIATIRPLQQRRIALAGA